MRGPRGRLSRHGHEPVHVDAEQFARTELGRPFVGIESGAVRRALTNEVPASEQIWKDVLHLVRESLSISKELEMEHLGAEAERVRMMRHDEAIKELLCARKIPQRERVIRSVRPTDVFEY